MVRGHHSGDVSHKRILNFQPNQDYLRDRFPSECGDRGFTVRQVPKNEVVIQFRIGKAIMDDEASDDGHEIPP
jgi:hypothetical protein